MSTIRTRFAPSPTGFLHVGGYRTALYAYLFAKKHEGAFILRIEDTDRERYVDGAIENMISALAWGGIVADEGPRLADDGAIEYVGDSGPYVQSERKEAGMYKAYVDQLLESGHAYYAFDTSEELDAMRERQKIAKRAPRYDRTGMKNSLTLSVEEVEQYKKEVPYVVRLKVPTGETITFDDEVRGKISFQTAEVDDQVLLKSDGYPTYHLAVVVDDHLMNITHVIRGEEWLSSTPKHLLLYSAFGWDAPTYAHIPLLINEQGAKLSKRHGDVSVEDYKEKGYLPEAMTNFLAFLGWNPGTDQELFSMSELTAAFSLDRVSKSASVFEMNKFNWINKQWMMQLDINDLTKRAIPFFRQAGILDKADIDEGPEFARLSRIVALEQGRAETLADIPGETGFMFADSLVYDGELLVWKKSTHEDAKNKLSELLAVLADFDEQQWTKSTLEEQLFAWIKEQEYGNGDVLWPLRVSLSGQKNSPGPFDIAAVLGKDETLERIEDAIAKL